MQYPEPTLFVRRIMLSTDPKGKPRAVFRANLLNPRANWGKPVPTLLSVFPTNTVDAHGRITGYEELPDPVLHFDKYVAPLHAYLPLLLATAHHPLDQSYMKIGYDAAPTDKVVALRECFNTGVHAALLQSRNRCMAQMFERLQSKGYMADDAVTLISTRFEVGDRAVRKTLAEAGWEILSRVSKPGGTTMGPRKGHRLSRATEYRRMFKEIETAARSVRANTPDCSFSLEDLAVDSAPGGYPTHCPVTGVELEYGVMEGSSMYSPKVCRVDPAQPALTGNVMVVSKLGRGIVEGTMAVERIVRFMRGKADVMRALREWTRAHRVADPVKLRLIAAQLSE